MTEETYKIRVEAGDDLTAQEATRSLTDNLREIPGVLSVERRKEDARTMDLGTIVSVLATSGATLAIARGVADWLRRTHGTHLVIVKDLKSGSVKLEVNNISSTDAERIIEIINPS